MSNHSCTMTVLFALVCAQKTYKNPQNTNLARLVYSTLVDSYKVQINIVSIMNLYSGFQMKT